MLSDHRIAYFSTVAQVLPLLWIVLTLEYRVFLGQTPFFDGVKRPKKAYSRGWAIFGIVALVIYSILFCAGEFAALATVQRGETTPLRSGTVNVAMTSYLLAVVIVPIIAGIKRLILEDQIARDKVKKKRPRSDDRD